MYVVHIALVANDRVSNIESPVGLRWHCSGSAGSQADFPSKARFSEHFIKASTAINYQEMRTLKLICLDSAEKKEVQEEEN